MKGRKKERKKEKKKGRKKIYLLTQSDNLRNPKGEIYDNFVLENVTCAMLTSSQNGETVQSKGYHTMNSVSWFVTMRIVD